MLLLVLSCSEYNLNEKEEQVIGNEDSAIIDPEIIPEEEECDPLAFPPIDISRDESCTIPPEIGVFSPVLEWHWETNSFYPGYHQVMAQPIAIQLTDDNFDGIINENDIPDVVFSSFSGGGYTSAGTLSALSGSDGSMLWSTQGANGVYPFGSAGLAAATIDGVSPYIYATTNNGIGCFDSDGQLLWSTPLSPYTSNGIGYPAIADLEGDGIPEVIYGPHVLSAVDGTLIWTGSGGNGEYISFAADLDDDGFQEVIAGNTVYEHNGSIRWSSDSDGLAAIADLDLDGIPEIVVNVTNAHTLRAMDAQGNIIWSSVSPDAGGGPPTIADYDADGYPEIGVSGEQFYRVLEHDGTLKWSHSIIDASSRKTGSSVFDFEGDGSAEVVYADEEVLWVFDGATGTVELEWTGHSSGTLFEYPIIVDIDGDGSAEIVAASNDYSGHNDSHGITVIGDEFSSWNAGLSIWNQHAFSITNIEQNGRVPTNPEPNWYEYNNFRSGDEHARYGNGQADLYPAIALACSEECTENRMNFLVVIGNQGTLDIEDDIIVEMWGVRADGTRQILDVGVWSGGAPSGVQVEGIEFTLTLSPQEGFVDVVAIVDSANLFAECNEENNEAFWGLPLCP